MIDELDRALASEEDITPSDDFLASVMEAVRQGTDYVAAMRFPRRRFAVGLAAGLASTLITVGIVLTAESPDSPDLRSLVTGTVFATSVWACASQALYLTMAVVGSLLAVRLSADLSSE